TAGASAEHSVFNGGLLFAPPMLHPNSRTPLRDTPLRRNLGPRHLTARTRLVTATNAEKCESRDPDIPN
ncbi:hypothetical protein, partial [Nocardia seriolae]